MKHLPILLIALVCTLSGCAVIRPGEVGVKQTMGRLSDKVHDGGAVGFNPFVSKVIRVSVQTNNIELTLNLPTKEGLSVNSQISILYKIDKSRVQEVISTFGLGYESIIANVFRSASADVCAQYFAKDLHSGMRADIEKAIQVKMAQVLAAQGIQIDAVLMKSIQLPAGLATSIEQKLQAEQDVMRMEFILRQEKLEAERKIIEAKGTSDAQKLLSEGLTKEIIMVRSIEAFEQLSKSPNAKVIITDGKAPLLVDGQ
jgi:prohibitin 1